MESNIDQIRKTRLAQHEIELRRRDAHAIVVLMLRDSLVCEKIIKSAREQIKKWRENSLCSLDYIYEWEELLANPIKAAEILEQMTPTSIRLRQNSPFAAYLKTK